MLWHCKFPNDHRKNLLFFSDECASDDVILNVNSVFWSKTNPFSWEESRQHPPSVIVWAVMCDLTFFFARYIAMLQTQLTSDLQRLRLMYNVKVFRSFSRRRCPFPYCSCHEGLSQCRFPDRWWGKSGSIAWRARSPNFFRATTVFKQPVTSIKYESIYDLKRVVTDLFESIDQETLRKIHDRTFRRMPFHMDYKGQQVGPFDKKIKLRGFWGC